MTSETPSSLATSARILPLIREVGPWFYTIAVATLYVSGFLVLNANLAKYGVLDIEFVDARYFLAGACFAFYLVCFYLFAGRAVLFTPNWLREDLERTNKHTSRPVWSVVVFIHSIVTATFFCCLSSALFTSFAIDSAETAIFYAALAGAFLVLYTFDVTNLDVKFPRFSEAVTLSAKMAAIYAFFVFVGVGPLFTVFLSYITIFFFINLVLDGFKRYKHTADRMTFTAIYAVVFLAGSAVGFGTLIYGQVTTKLGGAKPPSVSIGLTDEARKVLSATQSGPASPLFEGRLVHQTANHSYIEASGKTVRFRAADIITLTVAPQPERQFWKEYFEGKRTESTPPKSGSRRSFSFGPHTTPHAGPHEAVQSVVKGDPSET